MAANHEDGGANPSGDSKSHVIVHGVHIPLTEEFLKDAEVFTDLWDKAHANLWQRSRERHQMAKVNVSLALEFEEHGEELATEVAIDLLHSALHDLKDRYSGEKFHVVNFHVQSEKDNIW